MSYISNVLDMLHLKSLYHLQHSFKHIVIDVFSSMPNMRIVIDRRATSIHAHFTIFNWRKFLNFLGKRIKYLQHYLYFNLKKAPPKECSLESGCQIFDSHSNPVPNLPYIVFCQNNSLCLYSGTVS